MPRQTKEIVMSAALALVSLANIFFVGGPVATIVGVIGVIFFGGGALLLLFQPQGFRSTRRATSRAMQSQPLTPVTPPTIEDLDDDDRAAAMSYAAAFQRFGVVADGVQDSDWFLRGCAGVISPGRPLTPDDVLLALVEAEYWDPNVIASEVAPNFADLNFEWDFGDVTNQVEALARLTRIDVDTSTELVDDRVYLRAGQHSATVDLSSAMSKSGGNRYYTSAYVALAELYRRNQTGFRLALMLVDFSGYVMRIPEDSIDDLNAALGRTTSDYNFIDWLDLSSNDLDDLASVTFDVS